jgi:hypothetical protein
VIGFSLQTKRIFYGGLASASGKSPKIYKVTACFFAFCYRVALAIYYSVLFAPSN